ncbi:hypothetical protein JKF63_02618 [Porcisia hertigi]|uniref:HD/PDEase domain-containing protein n=1 Tax=Porcisia hertigi TaxID=2761500 RepID=A0A836IFA1_9TRYP|nr:hypothetical protein JKF63_02618 [Porcisia hertigi]
MPPHLRARAESVQQEELLMMVPPKRPMSIYDALHGQIEFSYVIRILIDTPIVQRLRNLKQLGNTFYIYPGATHSRFEHSLGVCYLGMEFYRCIVDNHEKESRDFGVPEILGMTREELWRNMHCIGIAGLCHDLGHGPLSHLFESFVRSSALSWESELHNWSHEKASIMLLRKLWSEKEEELTKLGFTGADLEYVMLLIRGLAPGEPWPDNVGRGKWARFTTEIVANKRNGLDVDKLDYIQRDSLACLSRQTFISTQRLFQGARVVVNGRGETSIGYPDKLDGYIEEIFRQRAQMYREVYQHRVCKVIDLMTLDALRAVGDVLKVHNDKGGTMPLRSCVLDADFYVHTGDWIVSAILYGSSKEMIGAMDNSVLSQSLLKKFEEARHILQRIVNRQLYTTIGLYRHSEQTWSNAADMNSQERFNPEVKPEDMIKELNADLAERNPGLKTKLEQWQRQHNDLPAIQILEVEITQTAGDMNKRQPPVKATYFYNPRQSTHCIVEPHSSCNRTTSLNGSMAPVTSLVVVCRMLLAPKDKEFLHTSFAFVAQRLGETEASCFSLTPKSQLGLGVVSSQHDASGEQHDNAATPGRLTGAAEGISPLVDRSSPPSRRFRMDPSTLFSRRGDFEARVEGAKPNSLELVTPAGHRQARDTSQRGDEDEETNILGLN